MPHSKVFVIRVLLAYFWALLLEFLDVMYVGGQKMGIFHPFSVGFRSVSDSAFSLHCCLMNRFQGDFCADRSLTAKIKVQ